MVQETMHENTTTDVDIRPFRVTMPKEALVDLRRRLAATRWPDKEIVADGSQGAKLEKRTCIDRRRHGPGAPIAT
jgi:hypothetical protein